MILLNDFKHTASYARIALLAIALSGCGGGGGGGGGSPAATAVPPAPLTAPSAPIQPENNAAIRSCPTTSSFSTAAPPPAVSGKISGRITFDRIPFFPAPAQLGMGLDYASVDVLPARGVIVEALSASTATGCGGDVLRSTITDGDGWYQLTTGNSNACIRVRAQLYRASDATSAANWNIVVADNTGGDALYSMGESSAATAAVRPRRDMHAASGWNNGAYTAARTAAPFAILDTACKAMNAVIAAKPDVQMGTLTYFWSIKNTSDSQGTLAQGKIGGSFFSPTEMAIYLRGDAAVDTDEFDEMVIAHEFGHFATNVLSRSDGIGGDHNLFDYADPRVAFDEGWATAFAGLVLNTPYYRDSNQLNSSGQFAHEFFFNMDSSFAQTPKGWYAEASVQRALFNIGADSSFGGLGVGVEGLLRTFAGAYKTSPALASIFSYGAQLKSDQATTTANAIAQVLNNEDINGDTITPFAETETNGTGDVHDLPVYQGISLASPQQTVCSDNDHGTINMLSNRRYLRFDVNTAGNYSFTVAPVTGYTQAVAGFELLNRGRNLAYVEGTSLNSTAAYSTSSPLAIGTYVISAFHVGNVVKDSTVASGLQCFNVSVALLP